MKAIYTVTKQDVTAQVLQLEDGTYSAKVTNQINGSIYWNEGWGNYQTALTIAQAQAKKIRQENRRNRRRRYD